MGFGSSSKKILLNCHKLNSHALGCHTVKNYALCIVIHSCEIHSAVTHPAIKLYLSHNHLSNNQLSSTQLIQDVIHNPHPPLTPSYVTRVTLVDQNRNQNSVTNVLSTQIKHSKCNANGFFCVGNRVTLVSVTSGCSKG